MKKIIFYNCSVSNWLFACCFFIFLMVWIGGVTRLTQSGLSITEWKPISGVIPPFSEALWHEEFAKYQQSPEYLKKNLGMTLVEFKGIFWLEFIHRLVGRITGFVFLVPLVYFVIKQQINRQLSMRLGLIFLLGAMQGVVGWYMVKSGLKDAPHVSQYWLAFHLSMAFMIYGLILYQGLRVRKERKALATGYPQDVASRKLTVRYSRLRSIVTPNLLVVVVFLQCVLGAFVAGTHAGLAYNTFPDMNGEFVPNGLFVMSPWYINFFENTTTIQFSHRLIAYFTGLLVFTFCLIASKFRLTKRLRYVIAALAVVVIIQIGLGVLTLLTHVPVVLASVHQVFALVLFTLTIIVKGSAEFGSKNLESKV